MEAIDQLPSLPALKSLGELSETRPCVAIDTREQLPLRFTRLPAVTSGLTTGDYSVVGLEDLFSIERKSLADLVSCCAGSNRERFEKELQRLRAFRFKRLLIVGQKHDIEQHRYVSALTPKTVLNSVLALECRYDVPVVWFDTPEDAAHAIEGWVFWFAREIVHSANDLLRSKKISESESQFCSRLGAVVNLNNGSAVVRQSPPGASRNQKVTA